MCLMVSPRSANFFSISSAHFLLLSLLIQLSFLLTEAYILQLLHFLFSPSPTTHLLHYSVSKTCPLPLQNSFGHLEFSSLSMSEYRWDKTKPVIKAELSNSVCSPAIKTGSLSSFSPCARSVTAAASALDTFSTTA